MTKVVGNPLNLLVYDFIRRKNAYNGDFSDFVNQAIEYTMNAKGIEIKEELTEKSA